MNSFDSSKFYSISRSIYYSWQAANLLRPDGKKVASRGPAAKAGNAALYVYGREAAVVEVPDETEEDLQETEIEHEGDQKSFSEMTEREKAEYEARWSEADLKFESFFGEPDSDEDVNRKTSAKAQKKKKPKAPKQEDPTVSLRPSS